MRLLALAIPLCLGCAATPVKQAESPAETPVLLTSSECPGGEFRGSGIGGTESEALSLARSELAKQVNSSIKVTAKHTLTHKGFGEKEYASSDYESKTLIESDLSNAQDARIEHKKQSGNKVGIVVCMSRSDAAKGFIERQRLVADSLELASNTALKTGHPKRKNEAWRKTQTLWNEFAKIQSLLDGWGIAKTSFYEPASEAYSQARGDYKEYCQTSKLHWKPERENDYSSIAFSMLSKNLKMEKSVCQGNGISLFYKYAEPECSHKFGIYNCFYKPSLSVLSCDGTEYLLLENIIENSHQKQELALEKVKDTFKAADFWGKWESEIGEWMPKCE
jgi:hypothetical protein